MSDLTYEQEGIELEYSKTNIIKIIRDKMEGKREKKAKRLSAEIMAYANTVYKYSSKNTRMQLLRRKCVLDSPDKITNAVLILIYQAEEWELINKSVARLASMMFPNEMIKAKYALTTAAEIIALAAKVKLINTDKTENGLYIISRYLMSNKVKRFIKGTMYLPPMIVVPDKVDTNFTSGYLTFDDSVILKSHNQHGKHLALDAINTLNRTELTLSKFVMGMKEKPSKKLKLRRKKEAFKLQVKESKITYKLLKDKSFWQLWKFDGRGRIYSQGHHVNFQGADYKRASIELAKKEELTDIGIKWIKIGVANKYGHGVDKLSEKLRVEWFDKYAYDTPKKPEKPFQFAGMLNAYTDRKTGVMVGVDASSSGTQILASLVGCKKSLKQCNLINNPEGKFLDPPMTILNKMRKKCKDKRLKDIDRDDIKSAYMKGLYGSKAVPKKLFGEGATLNAYYDAISTEMPGVSKLLSTLFVCIDKKAKEYNVSMPDYHSLHFKIRVTKDIRIEIDELDHVRFTHRMSVTKKNPRNVSLVANMTHGVDGFVTRMLVQRCNYDAYKMERLGERLMIEKAVRKLNKHKKKYKKLIKFPVFNLYMLDEITLPQLSNKQLDQCIETVDAILENEPFEMLPVHDEYLAHGNNVEKVQKHYRMIMKELGRQKVINDLLGQLKEKYYKIKIVKNGWKFINGNYALS